MTGVPAARHCPACSAQATTRWQFLLVPGLKSHCRACGSPLRLRLTRQLIALFVCGAVLFGILMAFVEGRAFWFGVLAMVAIAYALDEYAWRRVPWDVDAAIGAGDEAKSS